MSGQLKRQPPRLFSTPLTRDPRAGTRTYTRMELSTLATFEAPAVTFEKRRKSVQLVHFRRGRILFRRAPQGHDRAPTPPHPRVRAHTRVEGTTLATSTVLSPLNSGLAYPLNTVVALLGKVRSPDGDRGDEREQAHDPADERQQAVAEQRITAEPERQPARAQCDDHADDRRASDGEQRPAERR